MMATKKVRAHMIIHLEDTSRYWSVGLGQWTHFEQGTRYTNEERATLALPRNGSWIRVS
jgi:hypothetical protein